MTKKLRSVSRKRKNNDIRVASIAHRPPPNARAQEPSNQGIPEEHYYGERTPGVTANLPM